MDAVAYSLASKQAQRIEKFIENPDSTSGIVTVPSTIAAGETITIPAGRMAVLPNTTVNGTLVIDGEVFVPSGSSISTTEIGATVVKQNGSVVANDSAVVHKTGDETVVGVKTFTSNPIVPTPTAGNHAVSKDYVDSEFARMQLTAEVATTSGTIIEIPNIPNWAKEIEINFKGVSTNGTSNSLIQVGNGTFVVTGYSSVSTSMDSTVVTSVYTSGFEIRGANASNMISGVIKINLIGNNSYVASGVLGSSVGASFVVNGNITLSSVLDRIRITTVNGTDTFDAGSISLLIKG